MKNISQIKEECIGEVFTLDEFIEAGFFNPYDGDMMAKNETDMNVWDNNWTWDDVKDYPYVCWYNK